MIDSESHKILLVDEHVMFTDGLRSILQLKDHIGQIKNASSAETAYELIQKENFDLVITDLCLPGMNGIELTKKIKKRNHRIPVLILSMHLSSELVKEILAVEAEGYLLKKANKEELFNAIEKIISGGAYYGSDITCIMMNLINRKQYRTISVKKEFTPREREVLQLICQEWSSKEIADKLCICTSTVETHRRSMFQKTNSRNVIGLIRYAVQNNLAMWH